MHLKINLAHKVRITEYLIEENEYSLWMIDFVQS